MRLVIQRCAQASVTGGGRTAAITRGVCVLVGIAAGDDAAAASKMARELLRCRIFAADGESDADAGGKWTCDVVGAGGGVLLVPQFTLFAVTKSGRPSFHRAMPPAEAGPFFERFVEMVRERYEGGKVECGMFGEYMDVGVVNSGPVTILLDSDSATKGVGM